MLGGLQLKFNLLEHIMKLIHKKLINIYYDFYDKDINRYSNDNTFNED